MQTCTVHSAHVRLSSLNFASTFFRSYRFDLTLIIAFIYEKNALCILYKPCELDPNHSDWTLNVNMRLIDVQCFFKPALSKYKMLFQRSKAMFADGGKSCLSKHLTSFHLNHRLLRYCFLKHIWSLQTFVFWQREVIKEQWTNSVTFSNNWCQVMQDS